MTKQETVQSFGAVPFLLSRKYFIVFIHEKFGLVNQKQKICRL